MGHTAVQSNPWEGPMDGSVYCFEDEQPEPDDMPMTGRQLFWDYLLWGFDEVYEKGLKFDWFVTPFGVARVISAVLCLLLLASGSGWALAPAAIWALAPPALFIALCIRCG